MDTTSRLWLTCALLLAAVTTTSLVKAEPCDIVWLNGETAILGTSVVINMPENQPNGSVVRWLNITGDNTEVNLSYDESQSEFFSFDPDSRNITLKHPVDIDDPDSPEDFTIEITCIDLTDPVNSFEEHLTVHILVQDYNEHVPTFTPETNTIYLPENFANGSTFDPGFVVTDQDRGNRIDYRIVESFDSKYFYIAAATKLEITLMKPLDYESQQRMIILIEAKDRPIAEDGAVFSLSSTATLTIQITDYDDLSPVFSEAYYQGYIDGSAREGTMVNIVPPIKAWDPDTMNATVSYRLLDHTRQFQISNSSGIIYTTQPLNLGDPVNTVVVMARQLDNRDREAFVMVTIKTIKANLNAPQFPRYVYEVMVTESEPVGRILVTTSATDSDSGFDLIYNIFENPDDMSIDSWGNIVLDKPLDYEIEQTRTIHVTASDREYTSTATVSIFVTDVNDNNPRIITASDIVYLERKKGYFVTEVQAFDEDKNDQITLLLESYGDLFSLNADGEIFIEAEPDILTQNNYDLLVKALDSGKPPREDSVLISVVFPPIVTPTTEGAPVPAAAVAMAGDNTLIIILGVVTGILLVVVILLVVYTIWRHRRTKEELSRAKAPHGGGAKGLTYRSADIPDDMPKVDLRYTGDTDDNSEFDGSTTIVENPLSPSVNEGYMQSSGSEMDRDVSEIEVETAIIPFNDEFGYTVPPKRYGDNGHLKTFQGDDSTSSGSSHSDSTGGSRRGLVNEKKRIPNQITRWDSDDMSGPQGTDTLINQSPKPAAKKSSKDKPEITVYF